MRKKDELKKPYSCLNRAADDEWLFVLLGRDRAAPFAIRAWCAERVRLGKNESTDKQIEEALACATYMESAGGPWPTPTPCTVLPLWLGFALSVVDNILPRFDMPEWPPMAKSEFRQYMQQAFYGGAVALLGALTEGGALGSPAAIKLRLELKAEMDAYIKQTITRNQ